MIMRNFQISIVLTLLTFNVHAQKATTDSLLSAPDTLSSDWSFGADVWYFILPGETDIPLLLVFAEYNAFYVVARYNYEDLNTASLFGGYRFDTGSKLKLSITPMIGVVFGNTSGIASGLEVSLIWKKLDFYSENELVFDFARKENNFFNSWTELAVTLFGNSRTGISASRTRLFQSDIELQKGIFTQYSFWKLTAGVHYFNPLSNDYYLIATLGMEF
jgi:hypothetical protein